MFDDGIGGFDKVLCHNRNGKLRYDDIVITLGRIAIVVADPKKIDLGERQHWLSPFRRREEVADRVQSR